MAFHPQAEQVCIEGFGYAETLCQATTAKVQEIVPKDGTQILMGALAVAGGALKTLSELIAAGTDGDVITGKANKETALVAALLVARIAMPHKKGLQVDFSPRNFTAAVKAAEKIAGKDLSKYLNKGMVDFFAKAVERDMTLGYWDYLKDVGPEFDNFSGQITNFTKH